MIIMVTTQLTALDDVLMTRIMMQVMVKKDCIVKRKIDGWLCLKWQFYKF